MFPAIVALAAWAAVGCAPSHSSNDAVHLYAEPPPPTGEPDRNTAPPPVKFVPAPPPPSAVVTATPVQREPSHSERFEERTGLTLSPLAKAMMDDCPARAWSKTVPKRRCAKDDQCGDGFCDRGRCAPFWTCTEDYGRRVNKTTIPDPVRALISVVSPASRMRSASGNAPSRIRDALKIPMSAVRGNALGFSIRHA